MLYRYAPDDAPDALRLKAKGLIAARSIGAACRIDLLDGDGAGGFADSMTGFIALAPLAPVRAQISLEGGGAWVLASPTTEEIRDLPLEDLIAIKDALGVPTRATSALGLSSALVKFLALEG